MPNPFEFVVGKHFIVKISEEDWPLVSQYTWGIIPTSLYVHCRARNLYLHRLIMNPTADLVVHHIDHNPLNNTRENLLVCTHSENAKHRWNPDAGISWHAQIGRYRIRLTINGQPTHIATAKTLDEARIKLADARRKYYGLFA